MNKRVNLCRRNKRLPDVASAEATCIASFMAPPTTFSAASDTAWSSAGGVSALTASTTVSVLVGSVFALSFDGGGVSARTASSTVSVFAGLSSSFVGGGVLALIASTTASFLTGGEVSTRVASTSDAASPLAGGGGVSARVASTTAVASSFDGGGVSTRSATIGSSFTDDFEELDDELDDELEDELDDELDLELFFDASLKIV